MKIVVLSGRALNPGDLSWEALRPIVELQSVTVTADNQLATNAPVPTASPLPDRFVSAIAKVSADMDTDLRSPRGAVDRRTQGIA
jgi:hypothetical protein